MGIDQKSGWSPWAIAYSSRVATWVCQKIGWGTLARILRKIHGDQQHFSVANSQAPHLSWDETSSCLVHLSMIYFAHKNGKHQPTYPRFRFGGSPRPLTFGGHQVGWSEPWMPAMRVINPSCQLPFFTTWRTGLCRRTPTDEGCTPTDLLHDSSTTLKWSESCIKAIQLLFRSVYPVTWKLTLFEAVTMYDTATLKQHPQLLVE